MFYLNPSLQFPSPHLANNDGLLAIGGDLSPERLILAYQNGIFPWYNSSYEPILWWSPNPRFVLYPSELKISKSMKQVLKKNTFTVTFDTAFNDVITACRETRLNPTPTHSTNILDNYEEDNTWLNPEMINAYTQLYKKNYAHSVEVWDQNHNLVGGVYGIAVGTVFCGESMFAKQNNASKTGFIVLVKHLNAWGFTLIDCQIESQHLSSLGAKPILRNEFLKHLKQKNNPLAPLSKWVVNKFIEIC